MNLTVEQVSRILNRLNICFTVAAATRLIDTNLVKVKRQKDFHQTGYAYLVDAHSFEQYLIQARGFDANKAHAAVFGN